MQNEIREQPTFAIASVVVVVATMLLVTVEISMTATENVFAYEKNQANAQANACGNGQVPTNTGCENIGSQIQGDGNAVAMAALHTFADVAQEPPGGPPTGGPPPQTCVECFTKFLTFREIVHFEDAWDPP